MRKDALLIAIAPDIGVWRQCRAICYFRHRTEICNCGSCCRRDVEIESCEISKEAQESESQKAIFESHFYES